MRTFGLALVAAAALGIVGLPPVLGTLAASRVEQSVAALDAHPLLHAELGDYERGWFASTARIDLTPSAAALARFGAETSTAQPLPVVLDLGHGPVMWGETIDFGLTRAVARADAQAEHVAELERELGVPYLFAFRGDTRFGGAFDFVLDVPAIDYAEGAVALRMSSARIEGRLAGGRLLSDGAVDTFEYSGNGRSIALRRIRSSGDNRLVAPLRPTGSLELAAVRARVTDTAAGAAAPLLDATGVALSIRAEIGAEDGLSEGRFEYEADALSSGPELDLENVALATTWSRLDTALLRAWLEALERLGPAEVLEPEAQTARLARIAERLIATGPAVSLDPVRFEWRDEPFEAAVDIETRPEALPAAGRAGDPGGFTRWLPLFAASVRASASRALARRIVTEYTEARLAAEGAASPEEVEAAAAARSSLTLAFLTGLGFLEERDERYFAELRLEDGRMTINGAPVPLGALR